MGQNLSNLVRYPNMGIWFVAHNSVIFCPILMYEVRRVLAWFGYVPVIWHNWPKKRPNVGSAVPRALMGGEPPAQKFGHGS